MSEQNPLFFYTFKWGDKYGPEYVIRLKNSLHKYCQVPFRFICITDQPVDGIECVDINNYNVFGDSVFTVEKLELMWHSAVETNILLDLDILIHGDITDMVTSPCDKPTFVFTHWTPDWHWERLVDEKKACFINSSFVKWKGNQASYLFEYYMKNRKQYLKEYHSLDKHLFYEHYMPNRDNPPFDFWPEGIFYNYNAEGDNQYEFLDDHKICLFNTSHLIRLERRYYELDNTPSEHTEIWESYDD